jgi:endonuclease YncB( thermonuclease family)
MIQRSAHPHRMAGWLSGALALVLVALAGSPRVAAAERLRGPIPADVVAVIDGDTLAVRAHIWLGQVVATHVRLLGIDAPELHGHCPRERQAARRAREALSQRIRGGAVTLEDLRPDKYGGRILARVRDAHGTDLGAALLSARLVANYAGGRRADWCLRLSGHGSARGAD